MGAGDYMPTGSGNYRKKRPSKEEIKRRREMFKKVQAYQQQTQSQAKQDEAKAEDFLLDELDQFE